MDSEGERNATGWSDKLGHDQNKSCLCKFWISGTKRMYLCLSKLHCRSFELIRLSANRSLLFEIELTSEWSFPRHHCANYVEFVVLVDFSAWCGDRALLTDSAIWGGFLSLLRFFLCHCCFFLLCFLKPSPLLVPFQFISWTSPNLFIQGALL